MNNYGKITRKTNPREKANFFSLLTFTYTGGLFKKAVQRDLEEDDIYEVVKSCKAQTNGDKFEQAWRHHTKDGKTSIAGVIWKCFGYWYLLLGLIHLSVKLVMSIYEPEAIGKVVSYFNPRQTKLTYNDALYYAYLMIGLKFFHTFYMQNYFIYLQQLSIRMRASFCSLVYRKALKLTPTAMNEISLGNIITVITKDVHIFEMSIMLFNDLWIEVIKTFVVCYLIYNKMGVAGFAGIGTLFIVLPAQVYIGKLIKNLRLDLSQKTDERLQATQEALSAIKIIKMYTWERVFARKVEEKRAKEMKYLMRSMYLKSANFLVGMFTSKVGFYALMITYIWLNETTDAEVVFYVMRCFGDLKHSISMFIPMGLGRGAELLASTQRISKVLNAKELDKKDEDTIEKPKIKASEATVKLKDKVILNKISTEIKPGLTVVTGPLGCGKSSLLKLFLNDYPIYDGKLISEGSISYSSQDPWLFPSSIKQNIIFGEELDERRYEEVVKVCALQYDFNLFDKGDETIVADGGKNLSGGQQARINLARAIYKKSSIYLLDDPLHALDPAVQDYIYNNCIRGFLKDEYVVLVTHNLKHKNGANYLIIMKEGEIVYDGSSTEVQTALIREIEFEFEEEEKREENGENDKDSNENDKLIKAPGVGRRKVYSEVKKEGKVDLSVYRKYITFGGGIILFGFIVSLFVVSETAESYSHRLLTNWINIQQNISNIKVMNHTASNSTVFTSMEASANWILKLYSGTIVSALIVELLNELMFLNFSRKASLNLHNSMIEKLTTAVMTFYDNYFIGNILNRFSQDLNTVDEQLSRNINAFIMILMACFGIIGLVASVSLTFLIPSLILVVVLFGLRMLYIPTSRSLKRLEAATRSPLIGHLNASMEGVTTIRASRAEKILIDEFDRHQDLFTSTAYMTFCVKRAFAFFMDILSTMFVSFIVAKFFLFSSDEVSGNVGLAITKASTLAHLVQFALMQWSDLENNMTSVERVLEYTEVPQDNYEGQTLENWPNKGEISYSKVSLVYKLERVLKDISFEVRPAHKIGIVGRTGAGKSSIISALFRLYNYEGVIKIDGVDIKTLSLDFFRNKISIIPQDPLLFQGTIRQNIDPLNRYTDDEIWTTLEKVHMRDHIHSLELTITDHGSNFSTGQRQLICLARAIIKKNKIVVLDEATANMDPDTELLVQKAITENFANCTVFIIAHRLHSVLECNKILVMEKGEIVEYADPLILMENKNSFFAKMLEADASHHQN